MTAVAEPRQGGGPGGPADLPPAPVPPRATSTPVALWRVGVLCAVVALLAGILVAVAAFDRAARLDDAAAKTRQLVTLTDARSQVAAADAAATAAFLKGGIEDAEGRNAYLTALDGASVSVNQAAASGIGDTDALAAVAEAIGSYRGTVEYARALNRQGLPIGAAYLRDAGTTLADDVVATLDAEIAAVSGSIRTNASPLTVAVTVVVLLAFVAGVALTFVVLSQRTRRYVNPGVALGAGIVAVVVVAWLVVTVAVTSSVNDAVRGPLRDTVQLAQVRTLAFDARSAENLNLIARGSDPSYAARRDADLDDARRRLVVVGSEGSTVQRALADFEAQLVAADTADAEGNYEEAVRIATQADDGVGPAFADFDRVSATVVADRADAAVDGLTSGRPALIWVGVASLLAGVGGAALAWWGVSQRRREYQ